MAHRTCPVHTGHVRCPSHVTSSVGFRPFGASDLWACLDVWCTPDMYCLLSGVPVWARLTSARAARAFNAPQVAIGAEIAVAPELHRTVRCTPDSPVHTGQSGAHRTCPVNYSGLAVGDSRSWRVPEAALPWRTGHCPVYTGQSGEL
jgi:hypothetical protein